MCVCVICVCVMCVYICISCRYVTRDTEKPQVQPSFKLLKTNQLKQCTAQSFELYYKPVYLKITVLDTLTLEITLDLINSILNQQNC